MDRQCEALIIGGGPAGATAAWLLARAGWSVVVCERKAFPRRKVCGEYLSATNLPLLDRLEIGQDFRERAGPPVRRVGLFTGRHLLFANLPHIRGDYGRALGRELLDTLLLSRAALAGAEVWQPAQVVALHRAGKEWVAQIQSQINGERPRMTPKPEAPAKGNLAHLPEASTKDCPSLALQACMANTAARDTKQQIRSVRASVVIAAHGSWDTGPLPTQPQRSLQNADDLLGFKAHFANSGLAPELMPLLAFPGGYGGMVHSDDGRVSLSCCVRRDCLPAIRDGSTASAGETVEAFLREQCLGVNQALAGARRLGPWLATGPLRTGIRLGNWRGLFEVGNCAGEAHPVVAEGISMALQSAGLLADRLIAWRRCSGQVTALGNVHREYAKAWRQAFEPRLRVAGLLAHWAMRPGVVAGTLPMLHCFPPLMSWIARWTGKTRRVQ